MVVYDGGCDWLTLTFHAGHEQYIKALTRCRTILVELSGGGEHVKRKSWLGYDGYQSYGLFVGEREDGFIIRASGTEAKLIEKEARAQNWDAKCTRLDLQTTIDAGQKAVDFGRRVQSQAEKSTSIDGRKKATAIARYQVAGRSTGLTLGSRSSERYCRFYDKSAEQRHRIKANLWRCEVEFKGQQARLMYKMLKSSANGFWLACSVVKTTFGIYEIDLECLEKVELSELPSHYSPNDDERRLAWLKSHVAGTVKQLIERGHEKEVREALRLL